MLAFFVKKTDHEMTLFYPSSKFGGVWCFFKSDTLTCVSSISNTIPEAQILQQTMPLNTSSKFARTQTASQTWSSPARNIFNA